MDLTQCLSAIYSVADLPRLVSALGHESLWEPGPSDTGHLSVQVIGQTGAVPWLAIESPNPDRDASAMARRLSVRGRTSLVFAMDPASRRLGIAVAFGRIPHLSLSLEDPDQESIGSLRKLAHKPVGGAMAFAVLAADALSTESMGRRFFRQFRATLQSLAAGLPGPMREEDRHTLALLQLTRVLFLYFIQTKGWLGGRERFLAEEVDLCLARRRQIHRDLLRPLFFGTLNLPATSRSRSARGFGAIPFLNGGLFEPHRLERRHRADIPNAAWRDAFAGLFEHFHFTVNEQDPTGVAPDMLGRVFEGVMDPGARHASGTFYTPAALVQELLGAAFVALVAERVGCGDQEAERRLEDGHQSAVQVLRRMTLLDPAVGSGAFLLGALERLASLQGTGAGRAGRKRLVLRSNLFGVDQNAAAVRLTELRLWLAVIADDPASSAEGVSPLPNLDCLIRQGDSLFDPLGWAAESPLAREETGRELAELRQQAIIAVGSAKKALVRRLQAAESRIVHLSLKFAEERHQQKILELVRYARGNDLFGHRRGLDQRSRSTISDLRRGLRQIRHAGRRLALEGEVPWFHYQSHFADVFVQGGFDVVIGNPPWLRSEALDPALRERLTGRYRWWRGNRRYYGNGPDLAVAFLERGLELAAPAGILAMLVPAKLMSAGYGAAARHALACTTRLHAIANLIGTEASEFEATVYPLAIIAAKTAPEDEHRLRTALSPVSVPTIRQTELRGGGPWILEGDRVREAIAELSEAHPMLGDRIGIHLGLKTGANQIFLNPPAGLEPEMLRWAIRGRDVRPFCCMRRTRLLWTHDEGGMVRRELPAKTEAYIRSYSSTLQARKDFRGGLPWVLFRSRPAVAQFRVVWADLARQLVAVALSRPADREHIPLNSCYVAPVATATDAECLAALLNSTWMRALARIWAMPAAGGFARFNARVVARLPLPDSAMKDVGLIHLCREARAGRPVQRELDDLVAGHLGISSSAKIALRSVVDGAALHRR